MNEVLERKKLYIFDLDGTVYLGGKPFAPAIAFVKSLRKSGKRVLFFTNNASHNPVFYLEKLTKLGFEPSPDEILTSGNVTIEYMKRHRKGKSIYLVGTKELERQFIQSGIELLSPSDSSADIVITSFDTSLTYEKLEAACRFIRGGAEYFSTHPDFNCPTEDGFIPDSGAISAFVTASTGISPVYFGKPFPQTVEMISEVSSLDKSDMCIFGDRLYTDIALGKRNGVTSILMLTGETTREDLASAKNDALPDFVFEDFGKVLEG